MRNKKTGKTAVGLGCIMMMMCAATGCTKESESLQNQEEEIIQIEGLADVDEQQEPNEETPNNYTLDNTQDETELEGDIISIGEDSMIVNKIFTHEQDGNESAEVAVSYTDENAVLITVYFSENTEFIVRTVKNGGVNGDADVENEAGTADDLKERCTVQMTGGYEGDDFHADRVIIYHFL